MFVRKKTRQPPSGSEGRQPRPPWKLVHSVLGGDTVGFGRKSRLIDLGPPKFDKEQDMMVTLAAKRMVEHAGITDKDKVVLLADEYYGDQKRLMLSDKIAEAAVQKGATVHAFNLIHEIMGWGHREIDSKHHGIDELRKKIAALGSTVSFLIVGNSLLTNDLRTEFRDWLTRELGTRHFHLVGVMSEEFTSKESVEVLAGCIE